MVHRARVSEIARQHGFKQESNGTWRGRCLAHNGKNPRGLAIWEGEGGSVGAKCHSAGCSYQAILTALGTDFTYEGRQHYYGNGNGEIDQKREPISRRRGPNKDLRGNAGTNRGLLVKLGKEDSKTSAVVLVEGEKAFDALESWAGEGYTPAHWVGGTGSVEHADYSPLADRSVILWPDNDEPGQEAMTKAAAALRNVAHSLRIVNVVRLEPGQDAADVDSCVIDDLLASSTEFQAPESTGEDTERIASGAYFTRDSLGFLAALRTLKLDIRQNSRGGSIELRRLDYGEVQAIAFYSEAGLTADGMGWAVMSENIASYIRDLLSRKYRDNWGKPYRLSVDKWQELVRATIASKQVDPVACYLRDLPVWDKVERIPTMFADALGAEDSALNRATACAFMIGAVKRTLDPGCQHDWLPVLIGEQGGGKTTFCRELPPPAYPDWFARLPDLTVDTQRKCEAILNAWIVECPELRVNDWVKAKGFIDDLRDRYRRPYAHNSQSFPRAWVAIGTANDEGSGVLPG